MNPSVQIQSLFSNNSESLILARLGANSSLRFLGPPRGVLPIGPNGIRGLGTLRPSPLSEAETNSAIISYNYTLDHQGLTTNISCIYDTQSPIRFSAVPNNTFSVIASGSCNEIGLADLPSLQNYSLPLSVTDQTLAFWACKSSPTGEQYPAHYIYLRGRGDNYEKNIGNISCTVPPIQPAIFPVMYQSSTRVFSTQEPITTSVPANTLSGVIEIAISVLGAAVLQAQTTSVNLVADSVDVLGKQAMGFGPSEQNEQYLPLYGAMIQGMLVDEVCIASNTSCP